MSETFTFTRVKRYKRGATHPDGSVWLCTRCNVEGLARRRRATVIAMLKRKGSRFKMPVGYCGEHTPEELDQSHE